MKSLATIYLFPRIDSWDTQCGNAHHMFKCMASNLGYLPGEIFQFCTTAEQSWHALRADLCEPQPWQPKEMRPTSPQQPPNVIGIWDKYDPFLSCRRSSLNLQFRPSVSPVSTIHKSPVLLAWPRSLMAMDWTQNIQQVKFRQTKTCS